MVLYFYIHNHALVILVKEFIKPKSDPKKTELSILYAVITLNQKQQSYLLLCELYFDLRIELSGLYYYQCFSK